MKTIQAQLAAEVVARPREVERTVTGVATSDGAGVKLTRVLTNTLQHRLDPFLMLDRSARTIRTTTSPVFRHIRIAASRRSPT